MRLVRHSRELPTLGAFAAQQLPVFVARGKVTVDELVQLPRFLVANDVVNAFQQAPLQTNSVLPVLALGERLNHPPLRNKCMQFVRTSFAGLRRLLGDEQMRAALSHETFEAMLREHEAEKAARELLFAKGSVFAIEWPADVVPAADGTLPYRVLSLKLDRWPPFVDPARRERYLSDEEFVRVLGMQAPDFYALPQWRQQRIKSSVGLF